MAALTADRQTAQRHGVGRAVKYQVDANVKIFAGSMVMGLAGYARPGADTAAAFILGVADETVDNTGGAAGAKSVTVVSGIAFKLAGNAVVQADVGKNVFIVDDQTVQDAATVNSIVAGKVEEIASDGIWVFIA